MRSALKCKAFLMGVQCSILKAGDRRSTAPHGAGARHRRAPEHGTDRAPEHGTDRTPEHGTDTARRDTAPRRSTAPRYTEARHRGTAEARDRVTAEARPMHDR